MVETSGTGPSAPPESPAAGRSGRSPSRLTTPLIVGMMAGGIVAVAFLVAILRGCGGAAPQAQGPRPRGSYAEAARPSLPGITPVSPMGVVSREGLTFEWSPAEEAREYEVTLYDTVMKRMWSSGKVKETRVTPPPKVMRYVLAGAPHHWVVTGYGPGGEVAKSLTTTFRIME